MIRIHIIHTGSVIVDRAIPYREKNPLAVTGFGRGDDKKLTLPVSCYLIEHPKGLVLIDTGWKDAYTRERPHRFFGLLDGISTPVLKEGESLKCRLADFGYRSSDIDHLFFSHLDFDHTSGLADLCDAKSIQASEEEIRDSRKYFFRYVKDNWNFAPLKPFHYETSGIGPVGRSFDVFGDGTLLLVNTPGHSHGHFSALVGGEKEHVLLAGDAVYSYTSMAEGIIPGFTVDRRLAKMSLDWVTGFLKDPACRLVAANHDPEIEEQTLELEE